MSFDGTWEYGPGPQDDLSAAQWEGVRACLARAERARMAKASAEIEAAAGVARECRFLQDDQGQGGYVSMRIHPTSYHYWGQRLGYACWRDAQFCREYLRDNPASRVTSRNPNPTVSFSGLQPVRRNVRETVKYQNN